MTVRLCPKCALLDAGWRDVPMSVVDGGIRWLDNGSQNTMRDALEHRQHRVDRYYALVHQQRTAITELCAEQQHLTPVQLAIAEAAA
jgi:hypothetical protein